MKDSTTYQHDILSGAANILLFFGVLFLVVHSAAPLFGGVFLWSALGYVTWVVFALCMKIEAKCIKGKQLKGTRFMVANILELICIAVWFPYPYNLVGVAFFSFSKFFGYKALAKQINE